MPEFEFDETKSIHNKSKHGIDFIEAQSIWGDVDRVIIPAKEMEEPRYLLIDKINKKLWSAIYTTRNGRMRIISVRRSRKEEIKIYGS